MEKKTYKKFHNPFPREPSHMGFLKGKLIYDSSYLHTEAYQAGESFVLHWHSTANGGYLSVHHKEEPQRALWSTSCGQAFVLGALGDDVVQESRGSFTLTDKAELLLTHQTIERINVVVPQFHSETADITHNATAMNPDDFQLNANIFFNEASSALEDGDGHKSLPSSPAILITGCIYSDPDAAACQFKRYNFSQRVDRGPFYGRNQSRVSHVGARYWLFFYQKRDHHLGFSIKFEQPVKQEPALASLDLLYHQTRYCESLAALSEDHGRGSQNLQLHTDQFLWLWSLKPLSSFERKDQLHYITSSRFSNPFGPRRRLMVSDMFVFKSSSKKVACQDELEKNRTAAGSCTIAPYDTEEVIRGRAMDRKLNRVILNFAAEHDEQFFGFGEQFSFFNLKGRRVPIMVQEQGLGRGDQPITAAVNLVAQRSGGDWHTTYAPVPYYITSKCRCLFLEEYNYSVFDLSREDQVQIQLHGEKMEGRIVNGGSPLELIERYTAAIGRMKALPDWIVEGAIVGMQGGSRAVRDAWRLLQRADVPISAFWLQDWVGQRKTSIGYQLWWNWELDEGHYPGWKELVNDLKSHGVYTLTYINPFLARVDNKSKVARDLFTEAESLGYLVKNSTESPYMIPTTSFDAAMIDLTNPEACKWLKGIVHNMIKTGIKGWMADFGESLPFEGKLYSKQNPRELHNRYPEIWAQFNREAVEQSGDSELVFFMRSAYTKSPKWATLFWEGDQMVSWQRHDGIKSAVVGLLSSGISGFAFNHSDIGGYCTVDLPFLRYHRSEELLLRWMELNAFTTIFRTHEGNIPSVNHQFWTSSRSLQHFARFAKVYKAWAFYRKQLIKEGATKGLPIVRHMFLHYPSDPKALSICFDQFLVGKEILVVPVVDKGHDHVWAYFPDANEEWQHLWTSKIYVHSSSKICIQAPLGYPAVFVKKGSQVCHQLLDNLESLGLLPQNGNIPTS